METDINVVYTSDDNFAPILAISIKSLLENSPNEKITIWIIENNLSDSNQDLLKSIVGDYLSARINFISNKDKKISGYLNLDRGSPSSYDRIFVGSLLPEELSKLLYLDSDILILKNIRLLYEIELEDNIIGAVTDVFNKSYKEALGLNLHDKMFNNGVMLIDLKKWREQTIEEKLLVKLEEFKGNPIQADLGLLNSILYNKYLELHPRFNMMTCFYDFSYEELMTFKKPGSYYSKDLIENGKREVVLRHFTTSFSSERPWIVSSRVSGIKDWNCFEKKVFPTYVKSNSKSSKLKKMLMFMIKTPLRVPLITILGQVQLYVRPLILKLKRC